MGYIAHICSDSKASEQQNGVSLGFMISHVVTATADWDAQVAVLSGLKFMIHLHTVSNVGMKRCEQK